MSANFTIWLQAFLDGLGVWAYVVVVAMVYAETGLFLFVPAQTAFVVAGFIASRGHLSLPILIVCAATAAIAGDAVGYLLGRGIGNRRLRERGKFLFLRRRQLASTERFFARHGGKTVFLGRFISVGRVFTPFVAGMSGMTLGPFAAYNVSGGIVWATLFGLLGFFFGRSWDVIDNWLGATGWLILAGLVLAMLATAWWHRRTQQGKRT